MAPMMLESEYLAKMKHGHYSSDADNKRKAPEDLDTASISSKRIKSSHTASPEAQKSPVKVIPFPERVG
jgi:hypothetical protein